MHTRAPSASRTAPKPAAARSDAAVAPIPSALAAARSTSPAQWHGSHENDLIGVQHFTPNQPFFLIVHYMCVTNSSHKLPCTRKFLM